MRAFLRLLGWEVRHLRRDGQAWLVSGALLAAAVLAIWVGDRRLARHRAEIAGLHTSAVFQRESLVEWRYFDLESPLYGDAGRPVNGRIPLPQAPGLGLDPDPAVVARYRA